MTFQKKSLPVLNPKSIKEIISDTQPEVLSGFLKLLQQHVGLSFGAEKKYLVESRLGPIAQKQGFQNVNDLLLYLTKNGPGELHWISFEAMTTQETSFFRDSYCFDTLRIDILPELIQKRQNQKTLKIWSAATSTGQEAYSLAILLGERFPELRNWQVTLLATDFSEEALRTAKRGEYSIQELERGLTPKQIKRYFTSSGQKFRIESSLSERINFQKLNLIDPWSFNAPWDLILMRNVLIYFNQTTKNEILHKISASLAKDSGTVVLGSSETIMNSLSLKKRNSTRGYFYQAYE